MAITITLELPEAFTQRAQAVAQRTGRSLAAVLAEWLGQVAALDAAGMEPGLSDPVLTASGQDAAARVLLNALEAGGPAVTGAPLNAPASHWLWPRVARR